MSVQAEDQTGDIPNGALLAACVLAASEMQFSMQNILISYKRVVGRPNMQKLRKNRAAFLVDHYTFYRQTNAYDVWQLDFTYNTYT